MKRNIRHIVLLLIFMLVIISCRRMGSLSHSSSEKNEKYPVSQYKRPVEADYFFGVQDYEKAERAYSTILSRGKDKKSPKYQYVQLQLARMYYETRQFEKSKPLYEASIEGNTGNLSEKDINNCLDLLKRAGEIDRGITVAKRFDSLISSNTRFANIKKSLVDYNTYLNAQKQKVDIERVAINLDGSQYGVSLFRDGIVFVSNYTEGSKKRDLFVNSRMYYFTGKEIVSMNQAVKYSLQAGPASFYDNNRKMIYTTNQAKKGIVNEKQPLRSFTVNTTRLMAASFDDQNEVWVNDRTVSRWMGPRTSRKYSFMHPFVTEVTGVKRLYFSSDMPGGYGGMDIYYADWDEGLQSWGKAMNLGAAVNTNGDELYPAYYDGKLFFASNGQVGLGGLDIYWYQQSHSATAVHLPYPYNTRFDDFNIAWDRKKDYLYFTSDRAGEELKDKIYQVDMNKFPLADLGYSVLKKEPVNIGADTGKLVATTVPVRLNYKVFFEFNSDGIDPSQQALLDSVYSAFSSIANAVIDISGHADAIGTESYNFKLSKRRAERVREYLRKKGVPAGIISLFYYGDTKPIVVNDKEGFSVNKQQAIKDEAINRRCEIRIKTNDSKANR